MEKYILAGVGTMQLFDGSGNLILTSKTLTESSFSISVTAEDIRGGLSNPILGKYFHDSVMEATITDALFSLQYLATSIGGQVTVGGDAITSEQVTGQAGKLAVTGTPVAFGSNGVIGWYSPVGEDNWTKVTFVGKTATDASIEADKTYCVKYISNFDALHQFIVPAAIIPSECYMILTAPLFRASATVGSYTTSSQVGELQVHVPRFLLSGAADLSMTSSGAATTNLSGSALAYTATTSCDDVSQYAILKENIFGKKWDEELVAIAIENAEIEINASDTMPIKAVGIFNGGITGTLNPANLTYTLNPSTLGTVSQSTGVFTAGTAGTGTLEVTSTTKPGIVGIASVEVK